MEQEDGLKLINLLYNTAESESNITNKLGTLYIHHPFFFTAIVKIGRHAIRRILNGTYTHILLL
jgi:hypothetical protein